MAEPWGSGELVGRQAELSVVEDVLAGLAAGRGGSVLLVGEAGIGKSALLEAAAGKAESAGLRMVRGACDELGGEFPLAVVTELLGVVPGPGETGGEAGAGRGLPVLAGDPVMARAERLLGVVDAWCSREPLVLVLDDLQWADEASLVLWRRLGRVAGQSPLVLVGAARPVPVRKDLEDIRRDLRTRGGQELDLRPLVDKQVEVLVERWAGGAPGGRLAAGLASAAGNPLFVREVLDAWGRAGRLSLDSGVVELDEKAEGIEMASLAVVIADRLDFLSPGCRKALRAAALLGSEFSPAELAGVAGLGTMESVRVLQEAITAGVLESSGSRLRFRHGLIKQALYEAIPSPLRALLMQHAAQWLIETGATVDRVARALHLIGDGLDTAALDWLAEHIGELVGLAPTLAYDLIGNGLAALMPDDARRALLEDHLALVALHLGRFDVAERTAHSILASSQNPERRGQALWNLGYTLGVQGRSEEGLALIHEACAQYPPESLWHARLTALRALLLFMLQRLDEAAATAVQALEEGERLPDPMASGYALHTASNVFTARGRPAESVREIERGLAVVAADPRLTDIKLLMLCNRAGRLANMDRYAESAVAFGQARAMAEQVATPRLASILQQSACLAFDQGRWDEVAAEAEAVLDLGFLETSRGSAANVLGLAATIAVHRDESEDCARLLGLLQAEDPAVAGPETQSPFAIMARALMEERAGHPEQGLAILTAALETEQIGIDPRFIVLPTLAQMAWRLGQGPLVRHAADLITQDTWEMSFPGVEALARWCHALADDDSGTLLEVAQYLRGVGNQIDLANALEDAAVLEARADRREAARAAVTEAIDVYSGLGAIWDARRARTRLRAEGLQIGARGPRKRPSTGPAALTPTEQQIAQLVARGGSNTEIAECLVLSRRTVEVHVSHILAKLQISSRREVAHIVIP